MLDNTLETVAIGLSAFPYEDIDEYLYFLQYGGHAMKTACASDAQAVLYLFSVIGCCIDSKGYPNERKGNHFIGIEAFTEIEDGNK